MAKLHNIEKLFDLSTGESITVGNNRIIQRVKYGDKGEFAFKGKLHGNGVFFASVTPRGDMLKVTLNDCGYLTRTTADAMADFSKAFGATLNVSIARGGLSLRFRNGAGNLVERNNLESGACHGPFVMGRHP